MTVIGFNRRDAGKILRLIDNRPGHGIQHQDTHREGWLPFVNASAETCPQYGVVAITGLTVYGETPVMAGAKPTSTHKVFGFNGPVEVPSGQSGMCCFGPIVIAATISAASNGQKFGVTGWELDPEGDPTLHALAYGPISDDAALVNVNSNRNALFEIAMTQTGGSQGNATTAPSWTYTIDDVDGNELATGYNPASSGYWVRHLGQMAAATRGIASYNAAGDLKVLWCNEQQVTEECV